MKEKLLVVTALIVVLFLAGFWWSYRSVPAENTMGTAIPAGNDESSITSEINSIAMGDLESEFEHIDSDLNSL